jgi:hypothetical protein
MTDEELRALYRLAIRSRTTPASRGGCPSSEAMLALVQREGDEDARLATFDHVLSCEAGCREEYERLRAIDWTEDVDAAPALAPTPPAVAGPVPSPPEVQGTAPAGGTGPASTDQGRPLLQVHAGKAQGARVAGTARLAPRPWVLAAALAASVVLAVAITERWRLPGRDGDVTRSEPGAGGVSLIAPPTGGQLGGRSPLFIWHAIPGTSRYTLEVLDTAGAVVHVATTTDTVYMWQTGARVVTGEYRWWVSATGADGARRRSQTRTVRITVR